jgi:hypothetical protein
MEAEGTQFKSSIHADLPEGHNESDRLVVAWDIVMGRTVAANHSSL